MDVLIQAWSQAWESGYLLPVVAALAALFFYFLANSVFRRIVRAVQLRVRESGIPFELLSMPFRMLAVLLVVSAALPYLPLSEMAVPVLPHAFTVASILGAVWFLMRLLAVLEQFILLHYASGLRNSEASARKVATHVSLARKILNVFLVVLAVAGVLMTFDTVRQVGLSILASAGIAGVMIAFAAQKSISTLIAGVQIAITQPISIDDVVIVENQWGRIEEISLTYVVVQIWDQRRLIVPITWFIERPFENWTRKSQELLGTVFIYADYAIPIDSLRSELERVVRASPLWDGRVVKLQVTNTTEKSVELRGLVSAANASDLWELRCLVREALVAFIRTDHPGGIPRVRMEMDQGPVVDERSMEKL
ncbi:mechanosensitive ion channel [Chlorobium phaeovibrioides]|uniref:Mechanosensitive ion channel n=1 Tax=Chlorobium phaeovibrioides TaxID=1094 RepID=A0A3S0L4T1_CHLPH|nr:mechanosensitive ion channel domain-containing protein [Chlorobium phaeovibrioides]MWV54799.1 mechanosensitive ion channel [Chlorobium phaeovibrioides]RTY35951.1 mechanosensitive ion channel [Chlorobium phaeovibrioides]